MSALACVNLMESFGREYHISFDEADDRQRRVTIDPWMLEIPCRRGVIYPYGGDVLGVMVDNLCYVAKRLAELACCRLVQDGHTEKTFLFDVNDFPEVADVVLPKRRRQVSEAQRQRLGDLSKRHGFKPHQSVEPLNAPTHPDGKSDPRIVPAISTIP